MRVANFSAGITKLQSAMETLQRDWELSQEFWKDEASRSLEENYLQPILKQLKETADATARLSEVIARAERECEPE